MEAELKRLRIKRGQLKAVFTRIESFMGDPVVLAAAGIEMLQVKKDKLVSTLKQFEDVTLDILYIDEKDIDDISDVEDRYFHLISRINETMGVLKTGECNASTSISNSKLPNIEISCFDGKDFTKFKPFMDLFSAVIDSNKLLSNVQKFFYLRKYVTGDALSVIINLPIVNESYPEALSLLKKRFDNKPHLVSNHIGLMLDLPQMQRGTAAAIRTFISEVRQQLYALKNLDMPTNSWDMLLISILSRKLDSYTNLAYHLDKVEVDEMPTVEGLLSFLEKRAIGLEGSSPSGVLQQGPSYEGPRIKSNYLKVTNIAIRKSCLFCNNIDHAIFMCPKFKIISIGERLNFVDSKKLCKLCLCDHTGKCQYKFKCKTCKQGHNSLLHNDSVEEQIVTLHSNNLTFGNILLPTIQVKVNDKFGHEICVKALLDSGSQASIIKKSLVDQLKLSPMNQKTNIVGIGNNHNQINEVVNISFNSLVNNVKFQVKCHVVDSVTTNLPQSYFDISKLQIPNCVQLADVNFNVPSEISLLLGADIYFKALANGHISLSNGLVLQNTLFGYIVGGSIVCNNNAKRVHINDYDVYNRPKWKTGCINLYK